MSKASLFEERWHGPHFVDPGAAVADPRHEKFAGEGNTIDTGAADARAALALADAASAPLLLPAGATFRVDTDLTLTGKVVGFGGVLKPASGVTVTIAGPFEAGLYQCFDLSLGGTVAFSRPPERIPPHWWGVTLDGATDDGPAMQLALDANVPLDIPEGVLLTAQKLVIGGNDRRITGAGPGKTIIQATSALTDTVIAVNEAGTSRRERGWIRDLEIRGAITPAGTGNWWEDTYHTQIGLYVRHVVNGFQIHNVHVRYTASYGINLFENCWLDSVRDTFVEFCPGTAYFIGGACNGTQLDGARAYQVGEGLSTGSMWGLSLTNCAMEDTRLSGMNLNNVNAFSIRGGWFEDHDLSGTGSNGGINVNGGNGEISGIPFSSPGNHAIRVLAGKVRLSANRAVGASLYGVYVDVGAEVWADGSNYFPDATTAYGGAALQTYP